MGHAYLEPGLIFFFLPLISLLKVNSEFQSVEHRQTIPYFTKLHILHHE